MTAAKKPKGAAPVYRSEFDAQAHRLALLGATDREVAEFFGVTERTVNTWKTKHPSFGASLREGKIAADARVAESLYRAAVGGGIVRQTRVETDPDGLEKRIVTESEQPADVQAARWWLKNRAPVKWKDKVELKEEINLNAFPPKEVLDDIYRRTLAAAAERDAMLAGRRERLGIGIPDLD